MIFLVLSCIVKLFKLESFDRILKLLDNFLTTDFLACRATVCVVIARIYDVIGVAALLKSCRNPNILLVGFFSKACIFEKDIEGSIVKDDHKFV